MGISDKISQALEKVEGNNRYYVIIGILAFFLLLDFFILMRPQLAQLKKINPQIKKVSGKINNAKSDMRKLDEYRETLEKLSSKFNQANLKVKSRDEIPVILEHIANVARDTGVKIDQIIPDTLDQELLTQNEQQKYYDLPIYIEARTGYHNLGRFLNKIGQSDISLRIGAFSITATSDNRYHLVKLTFRTTVFEEVAS